MNETQNDHDLLLTFKAEVTTKLDRVISDVKELRDNVAARVTVLEEEKVNKNDFDEYKEKTNADISILKRLVYIGVGIVMTVQVILLLYVTFHSHA